MSTENNEQVQPTKKKGGCLKGCLFTFIGFVIIIGLITSCFGDEETSTNINDSKITETEKPADTSTTQEKPKEDAPVENKEEPVKEDVPREHAAALISAKLYAETMHLSKAGLYDQLTSEYGEGFPAEAAQYAIDNLKHDWKENALKTAKVYAETMAMSDSAIYDQLTSDYGEKFTPEEAQYAIDNL